MPMRMLRGLLIYITVLLGWLLLFLYGAAGLLFRGPYPAVRALAVTTMLETSAAKFVPSLFLSDAQIEEILAGNTVVQREAVTDSSLVHTAPGAQAPADLQLLDVQGPTYKGKLLVVRDPARLYVGAPQGFGLEEGGMRVEEMVRRDGAAAGINGGGFEDINGVGDGGTPLGIVIQNGQLTYGEPQDFSMVIGFDCDNTLVVGRMTAQQALERGIRDALSFAAPALIVNGEPADIVGTGGGLNPRSAIGQCADGTVLLLAIDGRQSHSLGAGFRDIIDIMLAHGAVNAANLDGGSSTLLVYEDKIVNVCASLYGSRKMPTAFLVRQVTP